MQLYTHVYTLDPFSNQTDIIDTDCLMIHYKHISHGKDTHIQEESYTSLQCITTLILHAINRAF
uniref:Uncharacterized protein n=1 Tax=Anguilla anguilla TaxID=7936 RepID=A0A0E9X0J1_ANGAN